MVNFIWLKIYTVFLQYSSQMVKSRWLKMLGSETAIYADYIDSKGGVNNVTNSVCQATVLRCVR